MVNKNLTQFLALMVRQLASPDSCKGMFHSHKDNCPLPSGAVLEEIVSLSRAILFPGYYGNSSVNADTLPFHIGVSIERLYRLLKEQILAGLCFLDTDSAIPTDSLKEHAKKVATELIRRLPAIRETLSTDVIAAYNGDPAACNTGEVIACYPIIKALANYRIAHELFLLGVPLIPRMLTEMAHSETGIDIHPQASIGKYFTIDHGTGVVIGATCIIGDNVKIY